jgi:hypothetical protein
MRRCPVLVAAGFVVLLTAVTASADRGTVAPTETNPWDGGAAVVTPLEALAGRVATQIAGHAVSVRCESTPAWRIGNGAGDIAGFVSVAVDPRTGRYARTSNVIELSSTVCWSLQLFAQAAAKPTRCAPSGSEQLAPCFTATAVKRGSGPAVCSDGSSSCYGVVDAMSNDYWHAYTNDAAALLTLAHEAVHTQQAQKGRPRPLANLVEQQAECWGMQWLPWVATQFGDGSDDAQTLASYYWLTVYPAKRTAHPAYWSAACAPAGSLDIRGNRSALWP